MSSSNKTPNLNLTQYTDSPDDFVDMFADYNADMSKIDAEVAKKLTAPNGTAEQLINGQGKLVTPASTPTQGSNVPFTADGAFELRDKSFVYRGAIEEGLDFNNIKQAGCYQWLRANYGTDNPNAPTQTSAYGILEVINASYFIMQRLTRQGDKIVWVRIYAGGTWNSWKEI